MLGTRASPLDSSPIESLQWMVTPLWRGVLNLSLSHFVIKLILTSKGEPPPPPRQLPPHRRSSRARSFAPNTNARLYFTEVLIVGVHALLVPRNSSYQKPQATPRPLKNIFKSRLRISRLRYVTRNARSFSPSQVLGFQLQEVKGTMGPRPPYEEPRSPLHPGSPNQGPQDSVILA